MTTTYTLDVFNEFDADESDPDPYFHMTCDNANDLIVAFIEMWFVDHDEVVELRNERADDCNSTVTVYDVYADDETVAVAYVARTSD